MPKLSSKTDDAPAFQFYVKDWLVDTRVLNLKERGVWADTLAVMWTSPERGVLLMPSGRNPMRTSCEPAMRNACDLDAEWLRGTYGADADEVRECLEGIVRKGVATKRRDGAIYNRRMVRIAAQSQARSNAGRKAATMRWSCESDAKNAAPTPTPTPTPTPVSEGLGTRSPASASPNARAKVTISKADSDGCYQDFKAVWDAVNDRPYTPARKDFVRLADFLKAHGYAADPAKARTVFADLLDTAKRTHEAARQLTNPDKWDRFPDTLAALCQRVNHFTPANLEAVKQRVAGIQEAIRNRTRATGEQPAKPLVTITRRLE